VLPWAVELSLEEVLRRLPVVVLGDMNCDPCDHSAAHSLLLYGEASTNGRVGLVPASASESSSLAPLKTKKQSLGRFVDVYDFAYTGLTAVSSEDAGDEKKITGSTATTETRLHQHQHQCQQPPPTMICEHLYGVITEPVTFRARDREQELQEERHELSAMAVSSLEGMFQKFATRTRKSLEHAPSGAGVAGEDRVMCTSDVKRWLETINLAWDRGSEMRGALARMVAPRQSAEGGGDGGEGLTAFPSDDSAYLDWEGFKSVYEQTVNEGTTTIHHDHNDHH
jgi:hypothetical protein